MTNYVALLRAVNVGGIKLPMSTLKSIAAAVGLRDAQTLLQTGNLVFDSHEASAARLETLLEGAIKERVGLATAVMVRTADEWRSLKEENPLTDMAIADPAHLTLVMLKKEPTAISIELLKAGVGGNEQIERGKRELYISYPDGIARSKLTLKLIEQKLGTTGTARNWNTVLKIGKALL